MENLFELNSDRGFAFSRHTIYGFSGCCILKRILWQTQRLLCSHQNSENKAEICGLLTKTKSIPLQDYWNHPVCTFSIVRFQGTGLSFAKPKPQMLPYLTLIEINRQTATAVYVQIANAIVRHVKNGVIPTGTKLPGTRIMAGLLNIHRKTAVAAYDELAAQGWIEQIPSKGTFVSRQLPEIQPQALPQTAKGIRQNPHPAQAGFTFSKDTILQRPALKAGNLLGFDDGFPDVRLAPLDVLARKYRAILKRGFQKKLLSYSDTLGNAYLRQVLAGYLHQSRGLAISEDTVCITRGSVMGIYLAAQLICQNGDAVIVGQTNYLTASMIFQQIGAKVIKVPVDGQGISVDAIEQMCQKQRIRLLYVTPHHHYPTTVTLSAERRIRLLQLAGQYGFVILEDDYDYDYHYASSPILPLASADTHGMVVYVGSLSKVIAPAFRVGYVVAPPDFIEQMGCLRRIIDRQGDTILEQAVAELIAEGELKRHLKKAQKLYHQRRDRFCGLLENHFEDAMHFKIPAGGMAVWAEFNESLSLPKLAENARKNGLLLGDGRNYDAWNINATRMGFASLTMNEMEKAVEMLAAVVKKNGE